MPLARRPRKIIRCPVWASDSCGVFGLLDHSDDNEDPPPVGGAGPTSSMLPAGSARTSAPARWPPATSLPFPQGRHPAAQARLDQVKGMDGLAPDWRSVSEASRAGRCRPPCAEEPDALCTRSSTVMSHRSGRQLCATAMRGGPVRSERAAKVRPPSQDTA